MYATHTHFSANFKTATHSRCGKTNGDHNKSARVVSADSSGTTSVSECKKLPKLLQELARGSFGVMISDQQSPLCFKAKRHQETIEGLSYENFAWRNRERMKTVSVALVFCLNLGVNPPDVLKIQNCARLECWVDPSFLSAAKAMAMISANLQTQYERWQPRARYKKCLDPTLEDVKRLCTSLRRNANTDSILFHYNGHGVLKPSMKGEIWVYNDAHTQYVPVSIVDLQSWMESPSIYVFDCSNAGAIINAFLRFAEHYERNRPTEAADGQNQAQEASSSSPVVIYKDCIQLAACSANQILPMNAELPADLFTSCLTTPINMALKFYTMQEKYVFVPHNAARLIDDIPGKVNDRRTMMGQLNWIFTAITDTIAWNSLPHDLFMRLFRQDVLVASLFRNFLLAERILRSHGCTPVSYPALPACFRHPLWSTWDLVVDSALQQLPDIIENDVPYRQLPFFEEHLDAFQLWLNNPSVKRSPPEQLPMVLQVVLSPAHRLRALTLLARFLDLGPWAVNLALSVGIFSYVLRLLQSINVELRPVLVFIWAKILAVDATCQVDLVKENKFFLSVLQDSSISKEHRTLSAFVLANIVNNFEVGQKNALQGSLLSVCLELLNDESWLLRQWLAICLGMLWQNFEKARWSGVRDLAHEKLYPMLKDAIPEVRAAAVFALGTFISSVTNRTEEQANNIDRIIAITLLETVGEDMSPLVRLELVAALQWMVLLFESQFANIYMQEHMKFSPILAKGERSVSIGHGLPVVVPMPHSTRSLERPTPMRRVFSSSSVSNLSYTTTTVPFQSIFLKLWQGIYKLGQDPFPNVAEAAQKLIAYVRNAALCITAAKEAILNLSLLQTDQLNGETVVQGNALLRGGVTAINNPLRELRTSSLNDETNDLAAAEVNIALAAIGFAKSVDESTAANSGSSDNSDSKSQCPNQIVTTEFIPWSISYFTRPSKQRYATAKGSEGQQVFPIDTNSLESRTRHARFQRNRVVRGQAKEQQATSTRIDSQSWMRRTQYTPSIVKLLPYESHIAVAFKEKVVVYDWNCNSERFYTPAATNKLQQYLITNLEPSSPSSLAHAQQAAATVGRVSSIEFLNPHDIGMVLVAHEDGVIRVWHSKDDDVKSESHLLSAWQGLHMSHTACYSGTGSGGAGATALKYDMNYTGVVTAWQQCTQQLIVTGGNCRFMRIWDVERELKLSEILLGGETSVRVLSPFPCDLHTELVAAGCADGSVRIFDKRCSGHDALVHVYREHKNALLNVMLKENQTSLVTGCSQGKICVIDMRLRSPSGVITRWEVGNDVLAIAGHQAADVVACGSVNNIKIFNQNGQTQCTIRSNESFISPKVGPPTCLSFHSYKVSLAVGFMDNTVAAYEPATCI